MRTVTIVALVLCGLLLGCGRRGPSEALMRRVGEYNSCLDRLSEVCTRQARLVEEGDSALAVGRMTPEEADAVSDQVISQARQERALADQAKGELDGLQRDPDVQRFYRNGQACADMGECQATVPGGLWYLVPLQ